MTFGAATDSDAKVRIHKHPARSFVVFFAPILDRDFE